MIKLSILILTHNRPQLFTRCIRSILDQCTDISYEILVNNDSSDIVEVYDNKVNIKYYYQKHYDISKIYKFLYEKSCGEYIYFLEDDDYLDANFFSLLDFNYDINFLNYIQKSYILEYGIVGMFKRFIKPHVHLLDVHNTQEFLSRYDDTDFQLGQILFKRNLIKVFPSGNNINNDYILFSSLTPSTIKYIQQPTWIQTFDGLDNISFEEFNSDERFK
jgi:glycosyltransferase involved in cell wall biosynthesis